MKTLDAALRMADLGYRVFPCKPGGKAPLTSNGFHAATTDPEQIEKWWTTTPTANLALATENLLVLDLDPGSENWPPDDQQKQKLAIGPVARTPRGGVHYYYRQPPYRAWRSSAGLIAPHVDVRANGGYVLLPPSTTADGAYTWVEELTVKLDLIPQPPPWLATVMDGLTHGTITPALTPLPTLPGDGNRIPSGTRNSSLMRIAGAMRQYGLTRDEIRAALHVINAKRCDPPMHEREVEQIATSVCRYAPDQIMTAYAEDLHAQMFRADTPEMDATQYEDPGPIPPDMLNVPGFISDMMEYTLENAPYPEPVLAFCGALALQSTLIGQILEDPQGNRSNVYILALANSGTGKDFPRRVNVNFLHQLGLSANVGDTIASGEGLEDRLYINPNLLLQTDEIDTLMRKINAKGDSTADNIMRALLSFYSSSSSVYNMRAKAGQEPKQINQPNLSLLGTAVPKHYYESLSQAMLNNGFFARLLVFEAGPRARGRLVEKAPFPQHLVEVGQYWIDFRRKCGGNLNQLNPKPKVVPYTEAAREIWDQYRNDQDDAVDAANQANDTNAASIWSRTCENAYKLALLYATSANHVQPCIDEAAATWACQVAYHCARRMVYIAATHVPQSEFHGRCQRLVSILREWHSTHGGKPMPYYLINRRMALKPTEHEEIRRALQDQDVIEITTSLTGGRPALLYRLKSK